MDIVDLEEMKVDIGALSTEDLHDLASLIESILDCRREEGDPLA